MKDNDKEIIAVFRRKALDKINGGYAKTRLMRDLKLTFDVFNRLLFDDLDKVEVRGSVIDKLQSYLGRDSKVSQEEVKRMEKVSQAELDEVYERGRQMMADGFDVRGNAGGFVDKVKEDEKAMLSGVSVDGKPVSDDNIMELLNFLIKKLSRNLPAGVEIVIKISSHKVI